MTEQYYREKKFEEFRKFVADSYNYKRIIAVLPEFMRKRLNDIITNAFYSGFTYGAGYKDISRN